MPVDTTRWIAATALGTSLLLVATACSQSQDRLADGSRCMDLGNLVAERLNEQHAVSSLPRDIRADLMDSLEAGGQVCLTAAAAAFSCNAGGVRAPDVRRCCKFSAVPQASLSGMPNRLAIRTGADPKARPTVEIDLRAVVEDLALDQRCEVPTCDADRASARAKLEVSGYATGDDGTTEISLRIDLGQTLELLCELPPASDEGAT
jgi:hypothetical protein